MSETGVQQGDPFGSLLYAIGFHPILLKLIQEGTLELCFGLEDDIILSGNDKAVAMALTVVQEEIAKIGLSLSLSKCELICSSVQNCVRIAVSKQYEVYNRWEL